MDHIAASIGLTIGPGMFVKKNEPLNSLFVVRGSVSI
jgi:hypothetical protein